MGEIKVGEYCRTNDGNIGIIEIIEEQYITIKTQHYHYKIFDKKLIKSHSSNIIDLIEVGDYVNDERIRDITGDYILTNEAEHNKFYWGKHIKSIVTHEQFESMKYRVEES